MIFFDFKVGLNPDECVKRLQLAFGDESPCRATVYRRGKTPGSISTKRSSAEFGERDHKKISGFLMKIEPKCNYLSYHITAEIDTALKEMQFELIDLQLDHSAIQNGKCQISHKIIESIDKIISKKRSCSLETLIELTLVLCSDEDAVQYQTLHDPPQLEPSDARGLQERGFKGRQEGQEAVLPAEGVAHIAVRRHSGPATLQQPPGGGGPAAGGKSAALATPRQENHEERGSKGHVASTCGPHSDSFNDTSRRRRSNCSTNNFQSNCFINSHLADANLKYKCPFRVFPLTPEHRQLRLQWCQARSMWNVTDWKKVVFSDESRFVLGTDDNHVRVWRCPVERYNSPHTVLRHTARTAGVMIWGL
ncbi:hypothetical protein TNCV_4705151 [Trichonephila clavipes]|nr:hypothetical protein TNCV_4705151 [Trichonephila clavipes]